MTWYSESYKQRQPVAVDASSTGSGAVTPVDITIEIPPDWDLFWENIRSDFFDVVVVDNEGQLLTFDRAAGANFANRVLTLEVNAYRLTTQTVALIYVYFQNPSESSDLATTFTPSSALTGHIDLSRPTGLLVTQPLQRPPSSEPQTSFVKASTDQIDIYFAVSNLFGLRASSYNSRFGMEGVEHVVIQSFDSSGSNDDARFDESKTRFIEGFVKVRARAGSNNTDYALVCRITTTETQQIDIRCLIQTRDQLPS